MSKNSFAVAYGTKKAARKKMSKGGKVHGTPTNSQAIRGGRDADIRGVHTGVSRGDPGTSNAGAHIAAHGYGSNTDTSKRLHKEKLEEIRGMKKPELYAEGGEAMHEHTADCFAIGGVVGGQAPSCGYARGVSEQDQTLAYGGSIYDRVKEKRMPKDPADLDEDEYPSESYSELNEGAVGKNYDAEQAGEQPMDSNEDGDDLMDADEHGKSMFKKIKLKRAQPGDRGKY